jgi:spore maturation protein SpmB
MDGKSIGLVGGLLYALGNILVYGPLRNNLGMSRVRVAYTAGEAIGPDLFSFYRAIGVNLKQLYGSTETTFYVLTVYFGSVGVRRFRHALLAGLTADFIGMCAAIFFGRLLFALV